MQSAIPFLSSETRKTDNTCLICNAAIGPKEKQQMLGQRGWMRFKGEAETWASIDIPIHDSKHRFTEVFGRVKDAEEAFGEVHKTCRTVFASNSGRYIENYGTIDISRQKISVSPETEDEISTSEARTARNVSQGKRHCFICDCKRDSDDSRYNEGGLDGVLF